MKKVTVCLSDSAYRKLKKIASEAGLSYARVVEGLVEKDHKRGKESNPDLREKSLESEFHKSKNEDLAWTREAAEFALESMIITHSSLIFLANKLDKEGYEEQHKSIKKNIEKYLTVLGYHTSTTAEKD